MEITTVTKYEELIFTEKEKEFLMNLNKIVDDIATSTDRWQGDVLVELLDCVELTRLTERGYVTKIHSLYDVI